MSCTNICKSVGFHVIQSSKHRSRLAEWLSSWWLALTTKYNALTPPPLQKWPEGCRTGLKLLAGWSVGWLAGINNNIVDCMAYFWHSIFCVLLLLSGYYFLLLLFLLLRFFFHFVYPLDILHIKSPSWVFSALFVGLLLQNIFVGIIFIFFFYFWGNKLLSHGELFVT